jgi:hypothetical protein
VIKILLVISEPVLSKKILALQMQGTDSHDWGGGRWNLVTYFEAFRDQLAPRGSLTCLTSHRRIRFALATDGLHRTILHQVRPWLLSCQVACRCRDQIPLIISEPVLSRRYWLSRHEVPIHMDGRKAELGHVLVKQ